MAEIGFGATASASTLAALFFLGLSHSISAGHLQRRGLDASSAAAVQRSIDMAINWGPLESILKGSIGSMMTMGSGSSSVSSSVSSSGSNVPWKAGRTDLSLLKMPSMLIQLFFKRLVRFVTIFVQRFFAGPILDFLQVLQHRANEVLLKVSNRLRN